MQLNSPQLGETSERSGLRQHTRFCAGCGVADADGARLRGALGPAASAAAAPSTRAFFGGVRHTIAAWRLWPTASSGSASPSSLSCTPEFCFMVPSDKTLTFTTNR